MKTTDLSVVIVDVTRNGSDRAVLLNGQVILKADPSAGDNIHQVIDVANNLCSALGCHPPKRVTWEAPDGEDWTWDDYINTFST